MFETALEVTVIAGDFTTQHSSGAFLQGSWGGALQGSWELSLCFAQCDGADGSANMARQGREPASTAKTSAQTTNTRAWESNQPSRPNRNVAEGRIPPPILPHRLFSHVFVHFGQLFILLCRFAGVLSKILAVFRISSHLHRDGI